MEPGLPAQDTLRIELREGMHLVLTQADPCEPWMPLVMAWSCSVLLDGKAVLLTGWPGTGCLSIRSALQMHPGLIHFMRAAWPRAEELIEAWLRGPIQSSASPLPLPYSEAWLAHDSGALPEAALRIDWRPHRR